MRIHVLFLILFSLLCLTRAADMLYSLNRYRLDSSLETLFHLPGTKPQPGDEQQLAALLEQKRNHVEEGIEAGFELLLLGGVCYCFLRVWQRKDANDVYVFGSKRSHAA